MFITLNELLKVGIHYLLVKTVPKSQKAHFLEGESPFTRVLIHLVKTNLGHYCEIVSEGDAVNRVTRSRISRPKCIKRKARRSDKLATVRK
jgi:hypothetical protein